MNSKILTRIELYELVWQKPLSHISKEFDISTDSIKTLCLKNEIPLPKTGHWVKLEYKKEVEIISLVTNPELDKLKIKIEELPKGNSEYFKKLYSLTNEIESRYPEIIKPKEHLSKLDKLIQDAKQFLASPNAKSYRIKGFVETKSGYISISVSKSNIKRAIRFMDSFIKLMKARGHSIYLNGYETMISVKGKNYKIRLREKCNRTSKVKERWVTTELIPSGKLCLVLDDIFGKEWTDNSILLEDKLAQIVAAIELYVDKRINNEILREKEREKWRQESELRQKFEAEKAWELKKIDILRNHSNEWDNYNRISTFISNLESIYIDQMNDNLDLKNWIKWAKDVEKNINPFVNGIDSFLLKYNFEINNSNLKIK